MKTKLLLTILFSLLLLNCKKMTEPQDDGDPPVPIKAEGYIWAYGLSGVSYYTLRTFSFDEDGINRGAEYYLTTGDKEKDDEFFFP